MSPSSRSLVKFWKVIITTPVVCWLTFAVFPQFCCSQEPQLGSTATLEQIQKGFREQPSAQMVPSLPREVDLVTEPAAIPQVRLEYRLWPNETSLKPGAAFVHLDRALVFYQMLGKSALQEWNDYQVALGDDRPDPADLTKRLEMFENVFLELTRFAEREDFTWDLRLRDLRGVDVYGFLLPEVSLYRELGHLLRFRALEQLGRRDFAGAIATLRCGYRLAAFVRQGETLIHQMVGIAIEGIMQSGVEDAIRTPGCPNLYYALATVPHERRPLIRALEFELNGFERVFPMFQEPESQTWSREVWAQKWNEVADGMTQLADNMTQQADNQHVRDALKLVLAAEVASDARTTRRSLVELGLEPEKVAAMSPEQAIATNASRLMRKWGNELLAAALLPHHASLSAVKGAESRILGVQLPTSRNIYLFFGGFFFPAVDACLHAELRVQSTHHRLLTIEAVRDYAATHAGQLPQSLNELTELPPQLDLFNGELIGYEVKSGPEGEWAEFSLQIERNFEEIRVRRVKIRQ